MKIEELKEKVCKLKAKEDDAKYEEELKKVLFV